jgi:hypothetical protein
MNEPAWPAPAPAEPILRETVSGNVRLRNETGSISGNKDMHGLSRILTAAALAATTATSVSVPADAATRRHHYHSRTHYYHKVCRYSSGATGLVAGGVGGALVGRSILGHGLLGTAAGAVGGAVAGRAIDRSMTSHRRCYWVRR